MGIVLACFVSLDRDNDLTASYNARANSEFKMQNRADIWQMTYNGHRHPEDRRAKQVEPEVGRYTTVARRTLLLKCLRVWHLEMPA